MDVDRRICFTIMCCLAISLVALTGGHRAHAGDFVYAEGELLDANYAGTITLGALTDSQSGPATPTSSYPGNIDREALQPWASVAAVPEPGHGVLEFYHKGWAAETPGANVPFLGLFQQGRVEFEIGADMHAWASVGGDQTFDVGAGLLSPAYVESGTTVGGLVYDLMPDVAFQETFEDYIHVKVHLNLTTEFYYNAEHYTEPYSDAHVSLDGETIRPAGDFQVLHNGSVVWEANTDGWLLPSADIVIEARYGDTISIAGGVTAQIDVDGLPVNDTETWSGVANILLAGQINFEAIPGAKPSNPIMAANVLDDALWLFDVIDYTEKFEGLGIDDPLWLAPENAPAYRIEVTGFNDNGDSILAAIELPELGDDYFDVFAIDPVSGEWVLILQDATSGMRIDFAPETTMILIDGFEDDFMYPFGSPIGLVFEPYSMAEVTITPVPEPATMSLLAAGLSALILRRRAR
jgi:PEP-CTERM motif-containing protein